MLGFTRHTIKENLGEKMVMVNISPYQYSVFGRKPLGNQPHGTLR
jgi:hypothetical protein